MAPRTQQQHDFLPVQRENQLDTPDGLSPAFREELGILLLAGEDFRDAEIVFTKPAPEAEDERAGSEGCRSAGSICSTASRNVFCSRPVPPLSQQNIDP